MGLLQMLQPSPEPACAFGGRGCSPGEIADYDRFRLDRGDDYAIGAVALMAAAACLAGVYVVRKRTPPPPADPPESARGAAL